MSPITAPGVGTGRRRRPTGLSRQCVGGALGRGGRRGPGKFTRFNTAAAAAASEGSGAARPRAVTCAHVLTAPGPPPRPRTLGALPAPEALRSDGPSRTAHPAARPAP